MKLKKNRTKKFMIQSINVQNTQHNSNKNELPAETAQCEQSNLPVKKKKNLEQENQYKFGWMKFPSSFHEMKLSTIILILILNIIIPGLGTIIIGCLTERKCPWTCLGIFQFFLIFIVVGGSIRYLQE